MQRTWEVVTSGPSKCGTASKDPSQVSREEGQTETEVLESPVVELCDETALKSGISSIAELPKEAIASPLFSGMLRGTMLGPVLAFAVERIERRLFCTSINSPSYESSSWLTRAP